jgi:hypothetical protein
LPFIHEDTPPKEVFSLATPQHILLKLAWEIKQFERASSGKWNPDAAYAAFNCAVTAFHCADWAWASAGGDTRLRLAESFDFTLKEIDDPKGLEAFCNAIEKESRDFRACRWIANGSKHMRLRKTDNPIRVGVEYSARGEIASEPFYAVDFVISDGDQKDLAIDVFRRVFEFWRDLFEGVGFIEPRFVHGVPSAQ